MKKLIMGCTVFISGILVYGFRLIAAIIASNYSQFKNIESGYDIIGEQSAVLCYALLIIGGLIILHILLFEKKNTSRK